MSDEVAMEITGDRRLGLRFEEMPAKFRTKLREVISEGVDQIYAEVISREPKGKTHKLANATVRQMFDDPNKITGRVAVVDPSQFKKAGALEYGSKGDFDVSGHFQRLDHVFAEKLASPLMVFVDSYQRQGGLGAYRFLRGPAQELSGEIVEEMREAVDQVVNAE